MPFTISHTIAVYPFKNQKLLPFSGLVIGAMVPDYPLFLPLKHYHLSHSITGLFLYDLPVGLLVYLLWSRLLLKPTRRLLPLSFAEVLREESFPSFWRLSAAIVLGAFTHVFWDGFTHSNGFALQYLPSLATVKIAQYPLYKILQWGCSVLGLGMLFFWFYQQNKQRKATTPYPSSKTFCWLVLFSVSSLVGGKAALTQSGKLVVYYGIVAFLQAFLLSWIFLSLILLWMSGTPQKEALLQRLFHESS